METLKLKLDRKEVFLHLLTSKGKEDRRLPLTECIKQLNKRNDIIRCIVVMSAEWENTIYGIYFSFQWVQDSTKLPEFGSHIDLYKVVKGKNRKWLVYITENTDSTKYVIWGNTLVKAIENVETELGSEFHISSLN